MTDPSIHTIYTGRSTNWPLIWLSTALVLPLLVMAKGSDGSWTSVDIVVPLAVIVSAVLANVVTASSLRATAGANGVTVHFGVFGWPRFRYPISRIQHAEAIEIPSSRWACGIYWSPRRGLMLTLRTGPALRLSLITGRKVTISTPHPDAAVNALDTARRGTHRPNGQT
jgi:hypothetical protein